MKRENREKIVKIIVYSALILLCCSIYLKFGLKEDMSTELHTEPPVLSPSPVPTKQPFPYRTDVLKALTDAGIPVNTKDVEEIYDGNYLYEFRFGTVQEKGSITLCVDEWDCVIYAELEFHNLDPNANEGLFSEANQLLFEIQKRDKDNSDLINSFILVCTKCMSTDIISIAELQMLANSFVDEYIEGSDCKESLYGISYQLKCDIQYHEQAYKYYRLTIKSKKN